MDSQLGNYTCSQYNYQQSISNSYHEKLQYEAERMKLDLYKQHVALERKIVHENELMEVRLKHQASLRMISYTVYKEGEGNIILAIKNPENRSITSKVLLNVKNYKTRIYCSYYPKLKKVLEISWDNGSNNYLFIPYINGDIDVKVFLKKLKARGIRLLVSGSAEYDAATALLAYSINYAESIEIPFSYGWGKTSEEKWHFATKDEMIMRGMIENV